MKLLAKLIIDNTILRVARYVYVHISKAGLYKTSIHDILWEKAILNSALYVEKWLSEAMLFSKRETLWDYALSCVDNNPGTFLEFGVFNGNSINYFSKRCPNNVFFGFDSFEGLSEDWKGHHSPKGAFNLDGHRPKVNNNVTLIKGWFNNTIPKFLSETVTNDIIFVHIDGDTYEAAKTVLNGLHKYLNKGVLVLFDEYIGYPNWENGEYKAWAEYIKENNIRYRYRAFCTNQALIEII
ncbi:MAG: class I SAM-dependent methyltransferase [Chlorobium sp.]|nr:class I SAM-dependent methyltransferase [Chlorobium sp.]